MSRARRALREAKPMRGPSKQPPLPVLNRIEITETIDPATGLKTILIGGQCQTAIDTVRLLNTALERAEKDARRSMVSLPKEMPADVAAKVQELAAT